jgi:hypothetical protein
MRALFSAGDVANWPARSSVGKTERSADVANASKSAAPLTDSIEDALAAKPAMTEETTITEARTNQDANS